MWSLFPLKYPMLLPSRRRRRKKKKRRGGRGGEVAKGEVEE